MVSSLVHFQYLANRFSNGHKMAAASSDIVTAFQSSKKERKKEQRHMPVKFIPFLKSGSLYFLKSPTIDFFFHFTGQYFVI